MEVAKQYRIKPSLIQKLVKKAKKEPDKLRDLKAREKDRCKEESIISDLTQDLL